jgi:AraC family transcriptional regulator, ethanolamine operon transcriptional activator
MGPSCPDHRSRSGAVAAQQQVVERAESYLRAHIDTRVSVSTLSRIAGRSERGLRNAFRSVRGMSPKRYMLLTRLEGVRDALSHASDGPATVTGIATDYGFYELGRFAADYRRAFGEAPSETLRGVQRGSSREQVEHHRV